MKLKLFPLASLHLEVQKKTIPIHPLRSSVDPNLYASQTPQNSYTRKLFEKLKSQRKVKVTNQKNNCAVTAVLDMLHNARFLDELEISYDQWPALLSVIKEKHFKFGNNTYSDLVDGINEMCESHTQTPTPTDEDAWAVLCTMRSYLDKFRSRSNYTLPVCSYSCPTCKSNDQKTYLGDLQYTRKSIHENYNPLTYSKCTKCGDGMVFTPDYLPSNFFIRLQGVPPRSCCAQPKFPYIKDYRFISVMQYNPQLRRFRTVKLLPNKSIAIMENDKIKLIEINSETNLVSPRWMNYIVLYEKVNKEQLVYKSTSLTQPEYTLPKRLLLVDPNLSPQSAQHPQSEKKTASQIDKLTIIS